MSQDMKSETTALMVRPKDEIVAPNSEVAVPLDIRSRIFTIRGVQVMFDRDLAELYQTATKRLNEQVRRNIERFPEEFMFSVSNDEKKELVANCDRFKSLKHSSAPMTAFTEHGILMLSSVLKSEVAVQVSVRIMRAFVEMRRTLATLAPVMVRLDNLERKQLKQQELIETNDANIQIIFDAMRSKDFPPQKIFFDGQVYDAFEQVRKFVRSAKRELILIDPYADDSVLDILANKRPAAKIIIAKGSRSRLHQTAVDRFNAQYESSLTVLDTDRFHDRFFILDRTSLIHIGMSLNHLGKKCFGFSTFDKANIPEFLARLVLDEVATLAQTLSRIYDQSYDMVKPIVENACKHTNTISRNDLEHIFDSVSDIYCCPKGRKLFDKLCQTFKSIYPDSVSFYIKSNREMYGN